MLRKLVLAVSFSTLAAFSGSVLAASIISKLMSEGATLPVGIVTSIVGVPFLFFLLLRSRE